MSIRPLPLASPRDVRLTTAGDRDFLFLVFFSSDSDSDLDPSFVLRCLAQNSSTAAHTHVSSARSHAPRRADLVCHWEDSDAVAQEVFANVRTPTSRLDCKGHAADLALPSALGLYHLHLRRVRGSDNIIPLHRDVPAGPWPDPRRRGKDCSSEIPSHDMAFARNAPETPETACVNPAQPPPVPQPDSYRVLS